MGSKIKELIEKYGLDALRSARDARVGAIGAEEVRKLASEGKVEEASKVANSLAGANTAGIAAGAVGPKVIAQGLRHSILPTAADVEKTAAFLNHPLRTIAARAAESVPSQASTILKAVPVIEEAGKVAAGALAGGAIAGMAGETAADRIHAHKLSLWEDKVRAGDLEPWVAAVNSILLKPGEPGEIGDIAYNVSFREANNDAELRQLERRRADVQALGKAYNDYLLSRGDNKENLPDFTNVSSLEDIGQLQKYIRNNNLYPIDADLPLDVTELLYESDDADAVKAQVASLMKDAPSGARLHIKSLSSDSIPLALGAAAANYGLAPGQFTVEPTGAEDHELNGWSKNNIGVNFDTGELEFGNPKAVHWYNPQYPIKSGVQTYSPEELDEIQWLSMNSNLPSVPIIFKPYTDAAEAVTHSAVERMNGLIDRINDKNANLGIKPLRRFDENTYIKHFYDELKRDPSLITDTYTPRTPRGIHREAFAIMKHANGGEIHIKPENRGKFTALKERTRHSALWFKAHGTPAQKKMAVFELNARKWKHSDGGFLHTYADGGDKPKLKRVDIQEWFDTEGNRGRAVNVPAMEQMQDSLIARGWGLPQRLAVLATAAQEMDKNGAASRGVGGNGYLGYSASRMPVTYLDDTPKGRGEQIHFLLDDLTTLHSDNWLDGGAGGPKIMSGKDGYNQFWGSDNVYNATMLLNKSNIRPAGREDSWKNRANVAKAMQKHLKSTGGLIEKYGVENLRAALNKKKI